MGSSWKSKRLAIRVAAADKVKLARAATEKVLGEQTRFRLSPARYRAFVAALDAPARDISALRRLFSRRSVLER